MMPPSMTQNVNLRPTLAGPRVYGWSLPGRKRCHLCCCSAQGVPRRALLPSMAAMLFAASPGKAASSGQLIASGMDSFRKNRVLESVQAFDRYRAS